MATSGEKQMAIDTAASPRPWNAFSAAIGKPARLRSDASRAEKAAMLYRAGSVNGHLFLPAGGHQNSPLVAIESPRWWPSDLPSGGAIESPHAGCAGVQVSGLTPLPAVAWASR